MDSTKKSIPDYRIEKEIAIGTAAKAYLLRVRDNIAFIHHAIIPPEQQLDISRYHFQHDRDKRLLTRSFLYDHLATHHAITDFQLDCNTFKKPFLRSAPDIHFSFSYAKEYVFIGISPGKKLGIDIEYIDRSIPIADLAESIMSPEELTRFRSYTLNSAEQYLFFFRLFSAKEAIIKAFGTGLFYEVKKINTLSSDRYEYDKEHFLYRDEGLWMEEYCLAVCGEV